MTEAQLPPSVISDTPQIAGYQVVRLLGRGGQGAVYEALRVSTGERVAIKLLRASLEQHGAARARLRGEGRALAGLEHPAIPRLVDQVALASGALALVVEFVDGAPLRERLHGEPLPIPVVLRWISQAAEALAHAHQRGVVHRDLKPENLLLTQTGLRIVDFGLAKMEHAGGSETQIQTGADSTFGTAAYMPPEQLLSARDTDGRADVFALGVILFEALAGARPHPGGCLPLPMPWPPPLRERNAAVPGWLAGLLADMLAADPAARPAMEQVASAVRMIERCPFPGLGSFQPEDALCFFGRDREIRAALHALDTQRWLQIEGASGSGKSSLLRAGLLPRLRCSTAVVRAVVLLRPGRDPLLSLAQALYHEWPALTHDLDRLLQRLTSSVGLRNLLREVSPPGQRVLLAIDQLEEAVWSDGASAVATFDASLEAALADEDGPLHLLTTMRSDAMSRLNALPALERRLNQAHRIHLAPLDEEGRREALLGPAARSGLRVEPALVDRLVSDTTGLSLPLLSHALHAMHQTRRGEALTLAAYQEMGGAAGALAQDCEALLDGLGVEQERAHRLLLSLVRTDAAGQAVRRPLARSEALAVVGGSAAGEQLLQRLATEGRAHLLILDGERVELIHESLLTLVPRLKGWIAEAHKALVRRDELEAAALAWERACRPAEGLPHGAMLAYFQGAGLSTGSPRWPEEALSAAARIFLRQAKARARWRDRLWMVGLGVVVTIALLVGYTGLLKLRTSEQVHQSVLLTANALIFFATELGEIGSTRNDRQEALQRAERMIKDLAPILDAADLAPLRAVFHMKQAELLRGYESLAAAETAAREAERQATVVSDREILADVLVLRGRLALDRGHPEDALLLAARAGSLLPGSLTCQVSTGRTQVGSCKLARLRAAALCRSGRASEAVDVLNMALGRKEKAHEWHGKLYLDLGIAMELLNDRAGAQVMLNRAEEVQRALMPLEKNRGYASYSRQLALILTARGSCTEAMTLLAELVQRDGEHRDNLLAWAAAARCAGRTTEADAVISRLLRRNPDDDTAKQLRTESESAWP